MSIASLSRFSALLAAASCISLGYATPVDTSVSAATSSLCCQSLSASLSAKLSYPSSAAYADSLSSYWTQQGQLITPACILTPTSARDVSVAVSILARGSCQFAVRSGGHTSVTGASNIQDGVTIDLRSLDATTLSSDKSLVSVGAGQRLGNLYSILHEQGLSIPGARAAGIGASGSTLGGGLGFINPSQGFAADSVVEFEIVTADGKIRRANKKENSDLWRALKGGGNNFGVVTQIVFQTFPVKDVWGGNAAYLPATGVNGVAKAFADFTADPNYDPNASLLVTYYFTQGFTQIANLYVYAAPTENPAAFGVFYPLEGQLGNQTSITTVPALSAASEAQSPHGLQQITFAVTFVNSAEILLDLWTIFEASIAGVQSLERISWALTFEPVVQSIIDRTKATGGNVLGLEVLPPQGLTLGFLSASFAKAEDYPAVSAAADKLLASVISATKKRGAYHPYIDLNHAKASQQPFKGYGSANYEFLKSTAKKYDPGRVFQTLVPGGFKL
ncbi:hypothetical protein GGS23DRAFT_345442 [Durotheca rogersii]|uniref:uncharacterized protein n=1 Tax=Durotheca rogersii TaxID=419775 RepID=UPI002220FD13|nr:uncharacterized protein GGS23DRAFT_345442 [Durotheca rogersii]KAI5857351.1 hypothetical protein GGS23DRAFT_345442 [Durotheca rogersii]